MKYHLVEKNNPLALHAISDRREALEKHIKSVLPGYIAKGYFMDKTLTVDSFTIKEVK
jgi:hypothetical protein